MKAAVLFIELNRCFLGTLRVLQKYWLTKFEVNTKLSWWYISYWDRNCILLFLNSIIFAEVIIWEGLLLCHLIYQFMTVWIRQLLAILCAFFLLEFYYGESKCSSPITAQYSHLVNTSNFLQYSNLICLALPVKAFPLWLLLNFLCKAQRCILLFFLALSRCKCSSAFLQYFRIWTS